MGKLQPVRILQILIDMKNGQPGSGNKCQLERMGQGNFRCERKVRGIENMFKGKGRIGTHVLSPSLSCQ
ncbi:MAG: hypothetical protein AMK69_27890 [Nitrospira bacterium SG8_3]|nr:MAG: hypothetical protein AMK69_27890 [Nitrospira bacterium SG8_3]